MRRGLAEGAGAGKRCFEQIRRRAPPTPLSTVKIPGRLGYNHFIICYLLEEWKKGTSDCFGRGRGELPLAFACRQVVSSFAKDFFIMHQLEHTKL